MASGAIRARTLDTMQFLDRQLGNYRLGTLVFIALVVAAVSFVRLQRSQPAVAAMAPAAPVPVVVETVVRRHVPHLTRAIGTVTSLHSVTVRSQVDGLLTAVHFTEGQKVDAGALLATIDDRAIVARRDQARAELARNEAELESARIDLARYRALTTRAAVAAQVVDQQAALVAQLTASIAANRAAIVAAEVELSHTRIVSPVRGKVGLRLVDPGNLVRAGDSDGLVNVTQIAPIAVIFALPQEFLPRLQALLAAGDTKLVEVREHADGEVLATGHLSLVDNAIDSTTGTLRVKAEFANEDERLWPGQFVTVELATATSPDALVVSLAAVQRGVERPFVYRVLDGQVEVVAVQVAYEDEAFAVIAAGLAEGDVVVTDGQSRLKPGTRVRTLAADDG